MKVSSSTRPQSGILLVECLVYIALWVVVTGLAFAAFYRVLGNATSLRHNADDMARALQAGEIWRGDVRQAIGPIKTVTLEDATVHALHIPQRSNEVVYFFTGTNILRRSKPNAAWSELLGRVTRSRVIEDTRGPITAWRWEIELKSVKSAALKRPLFTFQAVAGLSEKRSE